MKDKQSGYHFKHCTYDKKDNIQTFTLAFSHRSGEIIINSSTNSYECTQLSFGVATFLPRLHLTLPAT